MTQATIELTAAIIGLIAVTIPLVRSFVKWAHGKGILKLVFSVTINLLALMCYLSAVFGLYRWSANTVLWLLLGFVALVFFGFCTQSGQPSRLEIALFVFLVASGVALMAIGIFRPLPSTPKKPSPAVAVLPAPSPTPN